MKNNSALPAILGGSKAVDLDEKDANQWPIITDEDRQSIDRVLNDGRLSSHRIIREFEDDCKKYFGVKHVLTHCNGTAALLASFFALDLNPGDEIIVPSATFWASVMPMLWVGAIPVFCDLEYDRMGLDPDDFEKKITEKTRAVVVTHVWGMPCKMTRILEIARRHNLKVIEDASHAQGAKWRGKMCGALGDVAAISMVGSKLLPVGEGGLFLTDNDSYYERAACMGDIARIIELKSAASRFAVTGFGIKTRIASLSAAVAKSQLRRLDERNKKRNRNIQYLSQKLEKLGFEAYLPPEHIERVYFEFIIRHDENKIPLPKDVLVTALRAEGCDISISRYPLLHNQPVFTEGAYKKILRLDESSFNLPKYSQVSLPKTENFVRQLLRLPVFPNAEQTLLDQYVKAFQKVIASSKDILGALESGQLQVDEKDVYASSANLLVL